MPRKTIADIAIEVVHEFGAPGIMWGDSYMLDEIAKRAFDAAVIRKDPFNLHPRIRHPRILTALERSGYFKKWYVKLPGFRGNNNVRYLEYIGPALGFRLIFGDDS